MQVHTAVLCLSSLKKMNRFKQMAIIRITEWITLLEIT